MINLKCKNLLFCTSVLGGKKITVLNNFKNMMLFNNNSSSYVFNLYYKNVKAVGNSVNSLIQSGTNMCCKVMPLFKNRSSNIIICQKCSSFSPQSKILLQRPQPPTFSSFSLKSSNFCGSPVFNLFYKSKQLPCYYLRVNRRCFHKSSNPYNSVKVNSKNNKIVINVKNIKEKKFASGAGNEMKRLFALAKKEKWKLTGAVFLLLISSSITMAIPFSLGKVIDLIYTADQPEMKKNLNTLSLVLVSIFLLGGLCNFGRVYLMNVCGHRITKDLRQKVFLSIIQQETAFFDKNKTGELINRLSADTALVGQCVTMNISDGLRSLVMAGAGVSMMFYVSSELACVGLAIVPPVAVIAIIYGRFVRKITKAVQDALAESTQVAEERISNVRTVKSFSHEKEEINMYNSRMEDVFALAAKESFARGLFFGLTGLSGNVIILTVLYYGVTLVGHNEFTVGSLSAFLFYAAYVGISLSGLSSFYAEMNKGLGASSRLWEIIDRVPAISTSGGLVPTDPLVGDIKFQKVVFSYPSRPDCTILNELDLSVKSGSVTAVVGQSGSGKSTLASLIIRLYDPQAGVVLVDGLPVSTYDPVWLRSFIGTVSQEPVLFSGTIRDNIAYGASDPSSVKMESIEMAAIEANAFDFITKDFPEGFNTRVGERGIMLSGGQKQRVAIARALVKNPRILLLDEATSALDAESEHLVQEALDRIMKGRTVLTIAHRLSTIKNADQIAVLKDGKVIELGTYDKLMTEENGAFRKLVQHQTFHNVGQISSQHSFTPLVKTFQADNNVIL